MIEQFQLALPHGITLSCRAAGTRGQPVLVFLHGFPEAAFVWDELLEHFAQPQNGGYRCVAPNLRGFEQSSAPTDVSAYRPKHLVQDIAALIAAESPGGPIACLVAHDWGGAVAWNLANQLPQLIQRLAIVNSPHPGTFLRELKANPRQQAASAYMNFLIRPDAEKLLADDDFARMWPFFSNGTPGGARWLTGPVKEQYRAVWNAGLTGGCNYYRASPLRPPRPQDPGAAAVELPHSMLTVNVPTLVVWGMHDIALPPELIDGLDAYIPSLTLHCVEGASHWIIHEQPQRVAAYVGDFLAVQ
jgi:pimeloyl-ACP methyl ester carboxylesterase